MPNFTHTNRIKSWNSRIKGEALCKDRPYSIDTWVLGVPDLSYLETEM